MNKNILYTYRNTLPRSDSTIFWRIIFTFCIVALHEGYTPSYGWKMAVEYFFILSGMLLAMEATLRKTPLKEYLKNRIRRLWPHYVFSFIIYIFAWSVYGQHSLNEVVLELKHSILEIFMLQALGIGKLCSNHGAVWYVSVLFILGIGLYTCAIKMRKRNLLFLCIFNIFVGIFSKYLFGDWNIVTYKIDYKLTLLPGIIRGLSEMSFGIILFLTGLIVIKTKIFKYYFFWNIIEMVLMFSIIIYLYFHLDNQILITILIGLITFLSFWCEHLYLLKFRELLKNLGKITYPIYLNHPLFIFLLGDNGRVKWSFLFVIVSLYSIGTYVVVDRLTYGFGGNKNE